MKFRTAHRTEARQRLKWVDRVVRGLSSECRLFPPKRRNSRRRL